MISQNHLVLKFFESSARYLELPFCGTVGLCLNLIAFPSFCGHRDPLWSQGSKISDQFTPLPPTAPFDGD